MARVLAISSHVAFGTVGLAAITPALQALGHEVVAVPTIVLSSHPGYKRFAGERVAPATLERIVEALEANGWLAQCHGVLTGYLPTPAHVAIAAGALTRVRVANPSALVLCDPVFGDTPGGLYLEEAAAAAIRWQLLPLCDVATPNVFELSWLAERRVEDLESAVAAAHALGRPCVLATSVPAPGDRLATLLVEAAGARAAFVPRRRTAPHGTGDLLAALYLGHALSGATPEVCLGRAVAAVEASIVASGEREELALTAALWRDTPASPTVPV